MNEVAQKTDNKKDSKFKIDLFIIGKKSEKCARHWLLMSQKNQEAKVVILVFDPGLYKQHGIEKSRETEWKKDDRCC
jgi:hypothetical protein